MEKHRHSIRLWEYNYGQQGSYFITVCTKDRKCILSTIRDKNVLLTRIGIIVEEEILRTPEIRKGVLIDAYVIMPNHIHLLITIVKPESLETQSGHFYRQSFSIPSIVAALKAAVTRRAVEEHLVAPSSLWQRNYYEHVVRNDDDFERIGHYIQLNPETWEDDPEHPSHGS